MTGMRIVGVVALGVLLAGCGGGGGEEAASGTTATPTATAEPTPAESEGCRAAMRQADAIASEMETTTFDEADPFIQLLERLTAVQENAAEECTARVLGPLAEGVRMLAGVRGGFTACSFVEMCADSGMQRDLADGAGLVHEAATAATRTT